MNDASFYPSHARTNFESDADLEVDQLRERLGRAEREVIYLREQLDALRLIADAVRDQLLAERERCAEVAEDVIANGVVVLSAAEVGAAIRALPENDARNACDS